MSLDDAYDQHTLPKDDVSSYPADTHRLASYTRAEQQLSQLQAPVFIHANNPHERLYVACLDGTGNDEGQARLGPETNVAKIHDQIKAAHNDRIVAGYVPGPGTQHEWMARTRDNISGHTYDGRVEAAYKQFIDQAYDWKKQDPDAEIRVAEVGFSRGAEQEAGLARLVHERGIQDRDGAIYTRDHNNQITHVEYTKPPLVAPGQVAQAELLFDPVGTGYPIKHEDRRPPPSVLSGFQIIAADERRSAFKSDHIIDPGMTPDGRFLGVTVAGAHSDIGGSYKLDGLGIRSENLGINYLNALSDTPFLTTQLVPKDPHMSVVHRSEQTFPFDFMRKDDRQTPGGYNEPLVPKSEMKRVADPRNAEPRDESLNRQFERRAVPTGPQAAGHENQSSRGASQSDIAPQQAGPRSETEQWVDRLYQASSNNDGAGMHAVTRYFQQSSSGQQFQQQVQTYGQAVETQAEAQRQAQAQQATEQQATLNRSQAFGR